MNGKKIIKKAGNIGLSLIVLIAILLGSVPDLTVRVEAATPIISNPEIINLPLSSTGGTSYHRIYEMYNTNTGRPVYCTLKGQALPQSGFALQPMI